MKPAERRVSHHWTLLYHELFTKVAKKLNIPLKLKNRIMWRFGHGGIAKTRFCGRYEVVL